MVGDIQKLLTPFVSVWSNHGHRETGAPSCPIVSPNGHILITLFFTSLVSRKILFLRSITISWQILYWMTGTQVAPIVAHTVLKISMTNERAIALAADDDVERLGKNTDL